MATMPRHGRFVICVATHASAALAAEAKRRNEESIYRIFAFAVMVIGLSIGFAKLMGWAGRY